MTPGTGTKHRLSRTHEPPAITARTDAHDEKDQENIIQRDNFNHFFTGHHNSANGIKKQSFNRTVHR